jgi:hypothetical protein
MPGRIAGRGGPIDSVAADRNLLFDRRVAPLAIQNA